MKVNFNPPVAINYDQIYELWIKPELENRKKAGKIFRNIRLSMEFLCFPVYFCITAQKNRYQGEPTNNHGIFNLLSRSGNFCQSMFRIPKNFCGEIYCM